MTDERLRELERRWKESRSSDDEAAWLLERFRAGKQFGWESYSRLAELNVQAASEYLRRRLERDDLRREKVALAAYCSHKPALIVLGDEAPPAPQELDPWIYSLASYDESGMWDVDAFQIFAEAGVACALVGTEALASSYAEDDRPLVLSDTLRSWVGGGCKDDDLREEVSQASLRFQDLERELGLLGRLFLRRRAVSALRACSLASAVANSPAPANGTVARAAEQAAMATSPSTVRSAVSRRLVRWALEERLLHDQAH